MVLNQLKSTAADVASIQKIPGVAQILDVICRTTGMALLQWQG
jgi:hypothetical protein